MLCFWHSVSELIVRGLIPEYRKHLVWMIILGHMLRDGLVHCTMLIKDKQELCLIGDDRLRNCNAIINEKACRLLVDSGQQKYALQTLQSKIKTMMIYQFSGTKNDSQVLGVSLFRTDKLFHQKGFLARWFGSRLVAPKNRSSALTVLH